MKTIDFFYFIERYNSGEMNDAEKEWFLLEIKENQMLREEVELRARTDRVLNDSSVLRLRNKLQAIENQRSVSSPPRNKRRHSAIRYAAAIALLLLAGSLFMVRKNTLSTDEIIDKYCKPYEAIASARSAESTLNRDYVTAIEYYNIHDYGSAAAYFLKVLDKDPGDMKSTMLYGISNFEEKNYPVAGRSFNKVIDDNNNLYIEDAQWYLALCYMQTGDSDKAIEQLKIISKSESLYSKDAKKVLKRIR